MELGNTMSPKELRNVLVAICWATDYLLESVSRPNRISVQASDLTSAHSYCERPRNRDASREAYDVDAPNPASGVASEVAAALAFSSEHSAYRNLLIQRFRYEMQRPSDLPVTARGSRNRQWHRLEESSRPPYTHQS
ncbi:hypothetical protein VNO77_31026 [Canavalia gladiata]|uniref:cellulase n=1 Tax=Canavalia gladiata TaxID=3824 RepID=A0AAN9KNX9_CANGL